MDTNNPQRLDWLAASHDPSVLDPLLQSNFLKAYPELTIKQPLVTPGPLLWRSDMNTANSKNPNFYNNIWEDSTGAIIVVCHLKIKRYRYNTNTIKLLHVYEFVMIVALFPWCMAAHTKQPDEPVCDAAV